MEMNTDKYKFLYSMNQMLKVFGRYHLRDNVAYAKPAGVEIMISSHIGQFNNGFDKTIYSDDNKLSETPIAREDKFTTLYDVLRDAKPKECDYDNDKVITPQGEYLLPDKQSLSFNQDLYKYLTTLNKKPERNWILTLDGNQNFGECTIDLLLNVMKEHIYRVTDNNIYYLEINFKSKVLNLVSSKYKLVRNQPFIILDKDWLIKISSFTLKKDEEYFNIVANGPCISFHYGLVGKLDVVSCFLALYNNN